MTEDDISAFYTSWKWHTVRMKAILKYGTECMCCGITKSRGGVIHVDHVKPIRTHWTERFNLENLQILCESCNKGKGSWSEQDFRNAPPTAATPFVMIPYSVILSEDFTKISGNATKAYIALRSRFNGSNNGLIALSSRDAASMMGVSIATAARAINELEKFGFVEKTKVGTFSIKNREATEYRLKLS